MPLIAHLRWLFEYVVELVFGVFSARHVPLPPLHDHVLKMGAVELARAIRTRRLRAEHVVQAHIERIRAVNSTINAMVDCRFEQALAEARDVDRTLPSLTADQLDALPLLGVPFTSKESTMCAGMACTFGLVHRAGVRADRDASVIRAMKNAGAILLGVSNVPQLNMWIETTNPIYGVTRNPYDTARTVGGSSGGEAALLAACATPFGVGTDIGGSIRIPAFMCGVFGHKASAGLTDTAGMTFRDGSEIDTTMVVAGPMCRRAEDLIPGLKVLLGARADVLRLDAPVNVASLRIFYVDHSDDPDAPLIRRDVGDAIEMVIRHLGDKSKHAVRRLDSPHWRHSMRIYKQLLIEESPDFASEITNHTYRASACSELLRYVTLRSPFALSIVGNLVKRATTKLELEWAHACADQLRDTLNETLGDDGVLIYPTWPQTAMHHHVAYSRPFNFAYTCIFNAVKLPATQVPLGLSLDGLPVGVQVAAGMHQDRLCIAVAAELERAFGGYRLPLARA